MRFAAFGLRVLEVGSSYFSNFQDSLWMKTIKVEPLKRQLMRFLSISLAGRDFEAECIAYGTLRDAY